HEEDWVVVAAVERDPRKRTVVSRGPLGEQRRLAVPTGRDHRDCPRGPSSAQAIDEGGSRDHPRPQTRRTDLRGDDTERKSKLVSLNEDSFSAGTAGEGHAYLSTRGLGAPSTLSSCERNEYAGKH